MKPLLRALLIGWMALGSLSSARADEPSLRLGVAGMFSSWKMNMQSDTANGWREDSDHVAGGLQLVFDYRPLRYLDLGLKAAITLPHRSDGDGLLAAVGDTPTVFQLLGSVKGVLPLPGAELYAGPVAGYSLLSGRAYTADSVSHGLALGASLGMELSMTYRLALFVEAAYLHQFASSIQGPDDGSLRYDSISISAGMVFRL